MTDFFSCERPWAFCGLVLLAPAVALTLVRCARLSRNAFPGNGRLLARMRRSVLSRMFWWSTAWVMLVTAFSGISWGMELKAAKQTGSAVAFVFDVSHSMTARDVGSGESAISRLNAAASYAEAILARLDGVDVSAVIAKGDGMIAVPQTSDRNALTPLLASLSPQLMTSAGSSIGGGITAAAASFPALSVAARTILVFTDGEETDGTMAKAAEEVAQSGIQLVFLGFGSESETEILAGDGRTRVRTALRRDSLEGVASSVNGAFASLSGRHLLSGLGATAARVFFVPAQEAGSARRVIDIIRRGESAGELSGTVYEAAAVPRWRLFCALALVFLVAGFVHAELDLSRLRLSGRASANAALVLAALSAGVLLQGCSAGWEGASGILDGTLRWYRRDFRGAVASFMRTTDYALETGEQELAQYGLAGLAATYLAQGESDAAMAKFAELSPDAPEGLRFSALYNSGIVAYRNGKFDDAVALFRQALLVDGGSVDAKINLELSLRQSPGGGADASQEMIPAQESRGESQLESTIFSLVREKEQDKWKSRQTQEKSDSALDY